jgi:hypothetical protein
VRRPEEVVTNVAVTPTKISLGLDPRDVNSLEVFAGSQRGGKPKRRLRLPHHVMADVELGKAGVDEHRCVGAQLQVHPDVVGFHDHLSGVGEEVAPQPVRGVTSS